MMFLYGTKTFTKFQGYFGQQETCPNCHRTYSPAYVRLRTWVHFNYIPLFPVKTNYIKMCPVCGFGNELKKQEAKPLMMNKNENQNLYLYVKHVLHNKPQQRFQTDNSYELWIRDNLTGEEFGIFNGLVKQQIKIIKKNRGLKKLDIIDVN